MTIGKRRDVNMTQGNIFKLLVAFAVPLLLGNLFQQLYNMVDTWVVGRFVGDDAFSAVGTVGPILNLFIFAFQGFSNGAGVVVAQFFGAGNNEKVKRAVHTMVTIGLCSCVLFTVIGSAMIPTMLGFMKSPAGVIDEQMAYLRIIFAFISFQVIYNMSSALLQAVGDSTRPFIALVSACVTNIILDLLFVIKFNMGVKGVAWATIIAQGVSCSICIVTLLTKDSAVKVVLKDLCFDKPIAKKIFLLGFPTALQSMITSFSNVFVQGYINAFGREVMGGWTCYSKVDQIIMLPMQTLSMAEQTFVGQNLGAGNEKRAKEGLFKGILLCMGITAVLGSLVMIFAAPVSGFFTDSADMIHYGVYFLRRITPFFLICCSNMLTLSALRGSGNSTIPMVFTLFSYVAFRQIFMFAVSRIWPGNLLPIALAYPAGWVLSTTLVMTYYFRRGFGVKSLIADDKLR